MKKILVTPRSFAKYSKAPIELIENAGFTFVRNPIGQILNKEQMIECIRGCDGVIVGVDPLDRDVLDAAPTLRAIAKYGVGTDNIDLTCTAERGISVSLTAGANANAVADFTFAMMLTLARDLIQIDRNCRQRDWRKTIGFDVYGKTLGIIGLGSIGKNVARRARGFDMNIFAYDVLWDVSFATENGIQRSTIQDICRTCEFITLHLPLNEQTNNIIGRNELALMKRTAILINTSRGGIIDEYALLDALTARRIRGAGVDTFCSEPPVEAQWYLLDNLVMGNHAGAATVGAAETMSLMAAQNILRDLMKSQR